MSKEKHWIDNADSYICPVCRFECDNPAKYEGCKCPKCGFQGIGDGMADNEIIMALECCSSKPFKACGTCPFLAKCDNDWERLIDIINRQKAEIEHIKQMYEAAVAGQETLQQYFLTPDKPNGIMIRYNEKTGKWDKYEPYMTIECPEEKDYEFLQTAIAKQVSKEPLKESLADYGCPTCGAYINFDGLNGKIEHAPKYCSECGQALKWGRGD